MLPYGLLGPVAPAVAVVLAVNVALLRLVEGRVLAPVRAAVGTTRPSPRLGTAGTVAVEQGAWRTGQGATHRSLGGSLVVCLVLQIDSCALGMFFCMQVG